MPKDLEYDLIVKKLFDFCICTGCKFLFISGNGGSGKSTLAKNLKTHFEKNGFLANLVDADDFVTNSAVRRSAQKIYLDSEGNELVGSYTTSFEESYCKNSLNAAIFNLAQKLSTYHIPKHCEDESEYVLLNGNADVHIFEGVGTQFANKPKNCLKVYVDCDVEVEAQRRIARARDGEKNLTLEQVVEKCKQRRTQLNPNSISTSSAFDLVLHSNRDFSFAVKKDVFNVVGESMNKDCDFVIKTLKQASNLLINDFDIIDKGGDGDVVTSLDLNIEKFIIGKVKEALPGFDIISEEYSPEVKMSKNCVIVNGIDGSVNVSKTIPIFGMQMSVIRDGVDTASVVYLPFLNELYAADENNAYLNGKKLQVRTCALEKGLIVATGTKRIEKITKLQDQGLILRDLGSIAVAFVWVASSKINGAVYNGDKIWNYHSALNICKKAGAQIVDKAGEHIVATDKKFLSLLMR